MKSYALEVLKNIPINSKIAIYGTVGIKPFLLLEYIKEKRKDIKLAYFINSFKKGEYEKHSVILPEEIKENDVDFIIIASDSSYREIYACIRLYSNVPVICTKDYKGFFSYEKAENLLEEKEDRFLYQLAASSAVSNEYEELKRYARNQHKYSVPHLQEYFDFINKEAIKTVISGGGFDGNTALAFKYEFPNLKKNYMFEPLYAHFKKPFNDKILQKADWCSIQELGLWDKKEELKIDIEGSASKISTNESVSKQATIKTTSIDEFVSENNIEKVDFIKMDIEGAETRALIGGSETIKKHRPQLAICIYHSPLDYYEIPLLLDSILENYVYRLGHYSIWHCETVFYAIPKELYKP